MALFGKKNKKEETSSCCCSCNCDADSMAKAEKVKAATKKKPQRKGVRKAGMAPRKIRNPVTPNRDQFNPCRARATNREENRDASV